MIRAAVFIGVDRAGNLQPLRDAATGARRMHDWAITQGMADGRHAKLVTDADGRRVRPDAVYDAIKELVDGPGVDQLILYFAGHGVNINRGEQWLLSEAPAYTAAAVNVAGSVELARYCGIQHVIVISDACRTAPAGIQAQNVRGVDVFPNETASDRAKPVDQFFACALGRTAAEIQDPAVSARSYRALYTDALLDALTGRRPEVLESSASPDEEDLYVRPWRLQAYLEAELPRLVRAKRLQHRVNQSPDAIITSDRTWLARVPAPPRRGSRPPAIGGNLPAAPPTLRSITQSLFASVLVAGRSVLDRELEVARGLPLPGTAHIAATVERIATPFGPDHVRSGCGLKVRGAAMAEFHVPRGVTGRLTDDGEVLTVQLPVRRAVNAAIVFTDGSATLFPLLPDFLGELTFDDGDLVDVAYEPAVTSWRWAAFREKADEVRALRAVATASSLQGRLGLPTEGAAKIARRMQYAKSIDPTLAVHAAYAYHDREAVDEVRAMAGYQRDDLGVTFFDLELLGRTLVGRTISPRDTVMPFFPMLSQGWALLNAHRVRLPPQLDGVESALRGSLWTLFDEPAAGKLISAIRAEEIR
jgi:Caspase domain